jgi:Tfp pilus assembly protein PilF
MSLIMDAQKAAQREKDKRAGTPDRVPLLVPLKSKDGAGRDWPRIALLAGGAVAIVGSTWFVFGRDGDAVPRALRTAGPTISSIAAPPAVTPVPQAAPPREPAGDTKVQPPLPPASKQAKAPTVIKQPPTRVATRPLMDAPRVVRESPPTPPTASRSADLRVAVDNPTSVEVSRMFATAVAAQRSGDAAGARAAYERVLALAPGDVDALNNLGVLFTSLRQFDRAETVLRRAVSIAPSYSGAWANLGTVLRERGRSDDAIAAFQHALSLDARHAGARVGLAQQYIVIGALAQARQHLATVLVDHPSSPEANYAMGQVLERLGDRSGAIEAYSAFIRVAPPSYAQYSETVRNRIDALIAAKP